jgi:hypothetical protein
MDNNDIRKPTATSPPPPLQNETDLTAASADAPEAPRKTPQPSAPDEAAPAAAGDDDEIVVGGYKIQLSIPKDILKQVKSFNRESANKSAGFWAAQILKKNPQLTLSPQADPVQIWNEIKDQILKRIAL